MKTITAVIFFGILTYAFADTINYGGDTCQEVTVMKDFDTARFFSGIWYLTHATPRGPDSANICDNNYTLKTDGTIENDYVLYDDGECGERTDVHCNGTKSEKPGEFPLDCYTIFSEDEYYRSHNDNYYIATDYDTYGLVYTCSTSPGLFEDQVRVFFRNKTASDDEVKKILEPYGLDLSKFKPRDKLSCMIEIFKKK